MLICVLILYPASRLDWLVLGRLAAGTISNMPGNPYLQHSLLLWHIDHFAVRVLTPVVMLAAAAAFVALCVSGHWKVRDAPGPEDTAGQNAGVGRPGRPIPFPERAAVRAQPGVAISPEPSGPVIPASYLGHWPLVA